jgi:ribosomal protein S18 acetylase RimI-like enzyme
VGGYARAMPGVVVREAGVEDAAAVAEIHVRAWQAAYRGLMPDEWLDGLTVERRTESWSEILARSDGRGSTLVGVDDQAGVVGFCSVSLPSRDEDAGPRTAEISAFYIDPSHWRSGVGRALLEEAVMRLREAEWDDVTLWVLAGNASALAFYERFGFAADGAEVEHVPSGVERVAGVRAHRLRAPLAS